MKRFVRNLWRGGEGGGQLHFEVVHEYTQLAVYFTHTLSFHCGLDVRNIHHGLHCESGLPATPVWRGTFQHINASKHIALIALRLPTYFSVVC